MAKANEIVQIEEINKGLTALNSTLSATSENYLKLVKTISDGNKEIKDNALSFDNLAKAQKKTAEEGQKMTVLEKEMVKAETKLRESVEKDAKAIIAKRIETQKQNELLKAQIAYEKAAAGSIEKLTAENKKLYIEQRRLNLETEEGIKRNKEINAQINKNTDFIKANSSELVKHRINVGNYPHDMGAASEAFNAFGNSVGGATEMVSNAAAGMVTAGGAAGIFTVLIGTVASAWKRVQENIELYLASADKLQYGFAGYERDSDKALEDYRERLRGQKNTGIDAQMKARSLLYMYSSKLTDKEKENLNLQIKNGEQMEKEAREKLELLRLDVERGKWKNKYNSLLQDEEKLNDEKLAKETEWERLEAELTKQRAIVSDMDSTATQKKEAANKAEEISLRLAQDKTQFINKQIDNATAISEMTAKQEVAEDKINGYLKERNTIQKEYYSDQIKINRLEKTASKSEKAITPKDFNAAGINAQINADAAEQIRKDTEKTQEDFEKLANDRYETEKINEDRILKDTMDKEAERINAIIDANNKIVEEEQKKADKIKDIQAQMVSEAINGIFEVNAARINEEMTTLEKEKDAKLKNKHLTESQKARIEADYEKKAAALKTKQAKADKLQALFNIALNTATGIMKAAAEFPMTTGQPFAGWLAAMGLVQAGIVAAQPIPKYAKGTDSAASRGIFGEAGRELMFTRSGDIMLAEQPTYFEGSKFKGAKILSNPETEKMIKMSDLKARGYQTVDERLLNEMKLTRKAILDKPVALYDKENRMIGHATSHSQTIYLNRLMRNN